MLKTKPKPLVKATEVEFVNSTRVSEHVERLNIYKNAKHSKGESSADLAGYEILILESGDEVKFLAGISNFNEVVSKEKIDEFKAAARFYFAGKICNFQF